MFAPAGRTALAQTGNPKIDAAVRRGVDFLRSRAENAHGGRGSLAALALIKGGESARSPAVRACIARIQARVKDGVYKPTDNDHERIYAAGADLMALAAADPEHYRPEMEAIVRYILSQQMAPGYWDYAKRTQLGDTSMTQYALLGLWAARRAGIDVPQATWDQAARWLLRSQQGDGGFTYRPGGDVHAGSTHTMTCAGVGNLLIIRLHLYPDGQSLAASERKKQVESTKFGVLERVDLDADETATSKKKNAPANPAVGLAAIEGSARRGVHWMATRFTVRSSHYQMYYFYALERMAALAELDRIGNHDWFAEGAAELLRRQKEDGSWSGQTGDVAGTSFAILFLTRSTARDLGQVTGDLAGGLLAGGQGLPENLSDLVTTDDGKVEARKVSGPLDDLLTELEKVQSLNVTAVQESIVEKVQIGDRNELLKPENRKRLRTLAEHPNPEVRKTAVWALGRTGDIELVGLAFTALEKDPDYDVAVEAHNALCWISRRPEGVELPEGIEGPPSHGLPETASKDERLKKIGQWRTAATEAWRQWYLKVRPYDQRDDLADVRKKD